MRILKNKIKSNNQKNISKKTKKNKNKKRKIWKNWINKELWDNNFIGKK